MPTPLLLIILGAAGILLATIFFLIDLVLKGLREDPPDLHNPGEDSND